MRADGLFAGARLRDRRATTLQRSEKTVWGTTAGHCTWSWPCWSTTQVARPGTATTESLVTAFPIAWRQLRHVRLRRKVCTRAGHTAEACAIVTAALRAGEQPRDKLQQVLRQLEAAKVASSQPRQADGLLRACGHPPPLLSSTPATAQVAMLCVLLRRMFWSTSSRRRWDHEPHALVTETSHAPTP